MCEFCKKPLEERMLFYGIKLCDRGPFRYACLVSKKENHAEV